MKNIHEILATVGLTVPEDQKAAFETALGENYKTVLEVEKVRTARDNYKSQLETATATLKKFESIGSDPDKIQQELQDYKTKADEAEKNFNAQITQRDQRDWINKKLDEYGVASPYARKQLVSECAAEDSGLSWKDGAFMGFDDFMKSAKEKDNSLYLTAEEKAAAQKGAKQKEDAPKFTDSIESGKGSEGGKKFVPPPIF